MGWQCAKCGGENDRRPGRYCRICHAAYMREWRKTHRLAGAALWKDRARSYANTYQRRGLVEIEPCWVCGADAQKHHPDYDQPLLIVWLCRVHHLALHAERKGGPISVVIAAELARREKEKDQRKCAIRELTKRVRERSKPRKRTLADA